MKRRSFLRLGTGLALGSALAACGGRGDQPHDAGPIDPPVRTNSVVSWNQTALEAIRVTRPGPPMAARSLAVMHTAMYDAWSAYDRIAVGTQLGAALRRPVEEHTVQNKVKAMSFAAYAILADQFPGYRNALDVQMATMGFHPGAANADRATPEGVGTLAARAVIEHCHHDGSNQLGTLTASGMPYADYTGYAALNPAVPVSQPTALSMIPAPGNWQPLIYADANGATVSPQYLAACWHKVRPFSMASPSQFRPAPPAAPDTPEFYAQAVRVIEAQAGLTEKQKVVAEYWADGPNTELPPGHWCLFGQFVSQRDGNNDDQDVKLFFALANALFDAGIAAWDAKRTYDYVRPITAIRYLMNGKTVMGYGAGGPSAGLMAIPGEIWTPFQPATFPTPPFPEHVSGHSTFSAAAAETLKQFTGSDFFGASHTFKEKSMLIDKTVPARDVVLEWATFSEAAQEAGMSRIYGGIHFDNGNLAGLEMGRKIGALAYATARRYWEGMA